MIEYVQNADHRQNEQRCKSGETPCAICGKGIKQGAKVKWIHIHDGGQYVVTEAEAAVFDAEDKVQNVSSELGWWPVGNECMRKHPELKPYVVG
jgi:hypothetical protein